MNISDRFITGTADSTEWQQLYALAKQDKTHPLWKNYQNIDLETYETMIVTVRNNIPASFQGIYNNGRWPVNVSRYCNRAYINPYFRNRNQGLGITCSNIKYTLDNFDQWKKDVLFISRGVQYGNVEISFRKFKKFCEYIVRKTGYQMYYDDRLYRCCSNYCQECYQFCVWYDPMNKKVHLDIPSVSMLEWSNLTDL